MKYALLILLLLLPPSARAEDSPRVRDREREDPSRRPRDNYWEREIKSEKDWESRWRSLRLMESKIRGDLFRDVVASWYESRGFDVSREVRIDTPRGYTFVDVLVREKSGRIAELIECKNPITRDIKYTEGQIRNHPEIERGTGWIGPRAGGRAAEVVPAMKVVTITPEVFEKKIAGGR